MKVYGYSENGDFIAKLKEVTLDCNIEEIENLINFLKDVKEKHAKVAQKTDYCHSHFRDWEKDWQPNFSDVIILTNFGKT
jgi:hypothetical protein